MPIENKAETNGHLTFIKQAYIRDDFPANSNLQEVLELCIENCIPGRLEIHLSGGKHSGVSAITFWELHPVQVEGDD